MVLVSPKCHLDSKGQESTWAGIPPSFYAMEKQWEKNDCPRLLTSSLVFNIQVFCLSGLCSTFVLISGQRKSSFSAKAVPLVVFQMPRTSSINHFRSSIAHKCILLYLFLKLFDKALLSKCCN